MRRIARIEAELNIIEHTTELESYKQVEPRDGGKKPGFAQRTGSSLALGARDGSPTSQDLYFARDLVG